MTNKQKTVQAVIKKSQEVIRVTQADLDAYERIRVLGQVNMFDVVQVSRLSGLTKNQCIQIMKNYETFKERFAAVPGLKIYRNADLTLAELKDQQIKLEVDIDLTKAKIVHHVAAWKDLAEQQAFLEDELKKINSQIRKGSGNDF